MNSELESFQGISEMQRISAFPFLVSDAPTVIRHLGDQEKEKIR
jgi:hypothetical protein